MDITFDPAKDAANRLKHGISLLEALLLDWDDMETKPDDRNEYGEPRLIGYGFIGNRLYCVVYTERNQERRIISLRKANNREVKRYAAHN